jgi:hypothetical protein
VLTSVHPTAAARSVTGSLSAARSDAYAFEACDAASFSFSFCTASGAAEFDSWLCLFDDSGTLLSENDNSCGSASELTAALSPGSYFVAISAAAPNLAGAYTLSFSAGSSNCFGGVSSLACGCGAMGGLELSWNNPADAQATDAILVRLNDDPVRSFTAPGTSTSFHIEADDLSGDVVRVSVTNASGIAVSCDVPAACSGGRQVPGDGNQDGKLDISDGIHLLNFLFQGTVAKLPCGDGSINNPGNVSLLDSTGDEAIDLSDAVRIFGFLFQGAAPPVFGAECVRIADCADNAAKCGP